MGDIDYASMSDDDLLSAAPPVVDPTGDAEREAEARKAAETQQAEEDQRLADQTAADETARLAQEQADKDAEAAAGGGNSGDNGDNVPVVDKTAEQLAEEAAGNTQEVKPDNTSGVGTVSPESKTELETTGTSTQTSEVTDPKSFMDLLTAPFRANGKELQFTDPKQIRQLVQMGANYTQKMQALAPQRKLLQMLENAGLANEQDLTYFIDLKSGNQGAIGKLLKDSKFDVNSYDETSDPAYRAGNHSVDDAQLHFNSELQDVMQMEKGTETVRVINGWDQASKNELWKDPSIMRTIHEQRESGVYDVITAEVDKRRMLGSIPQSVGFLAAYEQVGRELVQAQQAAAGQHAPAQVQKPAPITTTVAKPKAEVANNDAAKAAGNTRSSGRKASQPVDLTKLSDDELMNFDISTLKV